jgi:hypothetical protein
VILARNCMCSVMMISDMLSKHVGAVKSVLKNWFKINDIQLVHLLVVWYLVKLNYSLKVCRTANVECVPNRKRSRHLIYPPKLIYMWTSFCFKRLSYFTQCAFTVQTEALFHENFAMRLIVTRCSNFFWFPLPSFTTGTTYLVLANNQLDALPLMYLFILPLYMFRTAQCSSSGDRLC